MITAGVIKLLKWGLIGCGDVTESKSGPAYQNVDGMELYAVCARTPGKARDFAKRHNVPHFYNDVEKLINDTNLDAVYIATPPDSHLHLALAVANADKICCIEKPMALNFTECQQIVKAFQDKQIPCFVAYYRCCLPGFRQIKTWLDENLIGPVYSVCWQYSRSPSASDRSREFNWRTQKEIAPGGYFDDLASHGVDILTFLLGPITKVSGITHNSLGLYSAADSVVTSWLFASGATGTGAWHFSTGHYQDKVQILGELGSIEFSVFSDTPAKLQTITYQLECEMPKPDPIQGPFVQAIADQLFRNVEHRSTSATASHTSWVMDKILGNTLQ